MSEFYRHDPLRGNKNAHTIAKKLRKGWPERKIAKYMGLPVAEVRKVRSKI